MNSNQFEVHWWNGKEHRLVVDSEEDMMFVARALATVPRVERVQTIIVTSDVLVSPPDPKVIS
jgi:hypothetical protein